MEDLPSWLALRAVKGLGPGTISRLVRTFGSPQRVQDASIEDIVREGRVTPTVAERIRQEPSQETVSTIESEIRALEQGSHSVLTILDEAYPERLRTIPDPPPLLYVTGRLSQLDHQAIAIVGSRKATPGGWEYTYTLSQKLAAVGFTVVSGLARGIDRAAHQGALDCDSGRTVAVLGCGIDQTYPLEHTSLREQIGNRGAVLSEFAPGTAPLGYNFPQRNRLISGMSLGVVVTEATEKSGSLITARFALDQNREVFAVPGPVTSDGSRGPHQLIKQGAKLVEGIDDIIEELLPQLERPLSLSRKDNSDVSGNQPSLLCEDEKSLYNRISLEPITLEDLISEGRCSASEAMNLLLSMEMKGVIRQLAGSQYIRTSV